MVQIVICIYVLSTIYRGTVDRRMGSTLGPWIYSRATNLRPRTSRTARARGAGAALAPRPRPLAPPVGRRGVESHQGALEWRCGAWSHKPKVLLMKQTLEDPPPISLSRRLGKHSTRFYFRKAKPPFLPVTSSSATIRRSRSAVSSVMRECASSSTLRKALERFSSMSARSWCSW